MIHFADLHLHPFKDHSDHDTGINSRLRWGLEALRWISDLAYRSDSIITFSGDLIHDPESMRNSVFVNLLRYYEAHIERRNLKFFAISGNHDMASYNGLDSISCTYLKGLDSVFKTFRLIDFDCATLPNKNCRIWGVPYLNNPKDTIKLLKDFNKRSTQGDYLLIHSDLPGAKTPFGIQTGDVDDYIDLNYWKKLTKKYTLVLAGHIHKHQKICNNTYMIGAPLHKDAGEINAIPGVMESYNGKAKFIETPEPFPRFIMGNRPEGDVLNYYIPDSKALEDSITTDLGSTSEYFVDRVALVNEYAKATKLPKNKTKYLKNLLRTT